jgi:hypothetical protein
MKLKILVGVLLGLLFAYGCTFIGNLDGGYSSSVEASRVYTVGGTTNNITSEQ